MKQAWVFLVLIFFWSCRSSKVVQKKSSIPTDYTVIYVIHGDSNYLYHTASGTAKQADKQALKEAKKVALEAKRGQVAIFYQKPERKILWLFPKKDRRFYYYRHGKLLAKKKYSPHSKSLPFAREAQLYNKYVQATKDTTRQKIFIYFGHEIPVRTSRVYNFSRSDVPLTTNMFAKGMAAFTAHGSEPFDLSVLSTCNNGTPTMLNALAPYSHYVLASPQNLHLSYITTGRLPILLKKQQSTGAIADSLASQTYQRLSSFLQTAITLSVYNTRKMQSYLPALSSKYQSYLKGLSRDALIRDNNDCARLPFFNPQKDTLGVTSWYRPARFGHKKAQHKSYSGWGCK